jgi:NADP-dependent 3-hydroxy acid dehydrogenase YdfG
VTIEPRPELSGKVAVVAGTSLETVLEVVRAFARNRMPVAVVAPDRDAVAVAADSYSAGDVAVLAVTADPADPQVWQRVAPHAEQRLGPIDIVVLAGDRTTHDVVVDALLPTMAARRRGVIVEVGEGLSPREVPTGVHHRLVESADAVQTAAAECG